MDVRNSLKDSLTAGLHAAGGLTIAHLLAYDPLAESIDDPDSMNLSRVECYAVGTLILIGVLAIWARGHPEASAADAVIVLGGEALIGGATVATLHWARGWLTAAAIRGAVSEREERERGRTWQALTSRRSSQIG